MSEAVERILNEFRLLSNTEQLEFLAAANELVDAVPGAVCEDDTGFVELLNNRLLQHLSGQDPGISAEELHAQVRLKYGK